MSILLSKLNILLRAAQNYRQLSATCPVFENVSNFLARSKGNELLHWWPTQSLYSIWSCYFWSHYPRGYMLVTSPFFRMYYCSVSFNSSRTHAPSQKYESDTKGDKPTAVLYGFHTALSAPFLALTSGLMALPFLLLDWTASPALFLIWLQTLFLLDAKRSSAMWPHFEYAAVVAWYLIAESAFYVTSHQPEFPSVQWASGLVGVSEGMHLMSGCLIGINTWGTFLTLAVALPLLVAWSPASSWVSSTPSPRELWLLRDPNGRVELRLGLQRITLLFQLLFALSTLLSCTAAGLHRRHLMVWKIFAPRVIFDCVKLLVTSAGTWVGWLFVARLSARLEATEHDFVPMAAASTD